MARRSWVWALSLMLGSSACLLWRAPREGTPAAGPGGEPPDQLAWELLAQSSQPVTQDHQPVAGWEVWDQPEDIFVPPGCQPHWPRGDGGCGRPTGARVPVMFMAAAPQSGFCDNGEPPEAHLNRVEYDYIVGHQIWNPAGLARWFQTNQAVNFPRDALSVKATWRAMRSTDAPGDFFAHERPYGSHHSNDGLISLHLTSKIIPNWFWATFEQEDNPCLGRDAQTDRFGFPGYPGLAPKGVAPTPGWVELMKKYGLDPKVWSHYRLIGVQTGFDQPTHLGNSVIEAALPTSSSCITCHAQARFDRTGTVQPLVPFAGDHGFVGPPRPAWYVGMRRLDFVWAFLCLDNPSQPCQPPIQ